MDYSTVIEKIKPGIALVVTFGEDHKIIGTGSGFVFLKKGILVTCNHVVKGANAILLKFSGAEEYIDGKVVLRDEEHDLALLKFEDGGQLPLERGELDKVREGMPVLFSGYPLNSTNLTTHQGILSAITKDPTGVDSYLIDGTVNSGNSGCPLMDSIGRVIGIVDAKRRVRNDLLEKVEKMGAGAVSLHGIDLVEIYHALINNVQLGVGHAIPAHYIPEHKDTSIISEAPQNSNGRKQHGR